MHWTTVIPRLLGLEKTCIERCHFDDSAGVLVIGVRPQKSESGRCSVCQTRCPGYDAGSGTRRWRAPDFGLTETYLEAAAPRIQCPTDGVVVAAVPWARPGSRFTRAFEDTVAWLSAHTDKTTVTTLLRIAWRTVGAIIERVTDERARKRDRFAGLRRIGIDEISYRKGQKYVVVVVDHDTGRLIWARPGRKPETVKAFFDELGEARCGALELVSADGAEWIHEPVRTRCPNATLCLDPFHIVQWATKALDEVRRGVWSDLRRKGDTAAALTLQRGRFALWKNPENLTAKQRAKLSSIQRLNKPLYRAYLLKEQLREAVHQKGEPGRALLSKWRAWAARCRLPAFVKLGKRIANHRGAIDATFKHGLSNARVEGLNTRLRLVSRQAFGFHSPLAFISLGMLKLGGLCPDLPGRT